MTASHVGRNKVVHPVVVVRINGYNPYWIVGPVILTRRQQLLILVVLR